MKKKNQMVYSWATSRTFKVLEDEGNVCQQANKGSSFNVKRKRETNVKGKKWDKVTLTNLAKFAGLQVAEDESVRRVGYQVPILAHHTHILHLYRGERKKMRERENERKREREREREKDRETTERERGREREREKEREREGEGERERERERETKEREGERRGEWDRKSGNLCSEWKAELNLTANILQQQEGFGQDERQSTKQV